MKIVSRLVLAAGFIVAGSAQGQTIHFVAGNPDTPIATGVIVPPGMEVFYVSGIPSASEGGTSAQTEDVLKKLGAVLKQQGYDFGDVVNAKVYLVADPQTGKMDFAGMNAAFRKFFGSAQQPNKPSRVTVQIAGLALPGALVEIELTAARKPRR